MRQFLLAILAFSLLLLGGVLAADAAVLVRISKSTQTMTVYVRGQYAHSWPVSTGRRGYGTPSGSYTAKWLSRHHRSRKYYNAPMPHSIFFRGGYAIHGSYEIRSLGRPASHGCVRLHPANARELFRLVQAYGTSATRIVIR
jgi:lipoprotein-anchoring transpeptidase ErfK/SrfK